MFRVKRRHQSFYSRDLKIIVRKMLDTSFEIVSKRTLGKERKGNLSTLFREGREIFFKEMDYGVLVVLKIFKLTQMKKELFRIGVT